MLSAAALRSPLLDGPPPAHTGGFGEPTCRACHQPGDSRYGSVTIEGIPASFTAGDSLLFDVVTRAPGLSRGGFQLAVRFAEGARAGRQAGRLVAVDSGLVRITRDSTSHVWYAHHSRDGTAAMTPNEMRWRLRWLAPDEAGVVVFHAASVIASDDNSPLDDEVVTAERTAGGVIPQGR